jgi:hypothetical protein
MADAFNPIPKSTVQLSVTTTSARVAIPTVGRRANSVRVVYTAGTDAARICAGDSSVTATTLTDMRCPNPGTPWLYAEAFSIDPSATHIAAVTDSGTCSLEFTFGFGQ